MSDYILIVDDEPDVRELFKITLTMAGYHTTAVSDGLQAIEAIKEEIPQLVLLDLMMPRLDGFGVLKELRANRPDGDLKILVATAKTISDNDKDHLDSWPVVGVLNKGELDIANMVIEVRDLLTTSSPAPAATATAQPAASPPPPASSPERKSLGTKPLVPPADGSINRTPRPKPPAGAPEK